MPRKRADGKVQINSWVDGELADEIRAIQNQLGMSHQSDAVKHLLEISIKKYGNCNNSPISKNRTRVKKTN